MGHANRPLERPSGPPRVTGRDRDRTLDVLNSVIRHVHGGGDLHEILGVVAHAVLEATCFGVIAVNLVMPDGDVKVVAVEGNEETRAELLGRVEPLSRWEQLIANARPLGALCHYRHDDVFDEDMASWVPAVEPPSDPDMWHPLDALFAPLLDSSGDLIGALSVDLPDGGRRPGTDQLQLLELFARHAALAIEHSRRRGLEHQLSALTERVRMSERVHDVVIQDLYAASLNISHAISHQSATIDSAHLETALDDLESAAERLRTLIGRLRAHEDGPPELIAALRKVVARATRTLPFEPVLTYSGNPTNVTRLVATELVALLSEALTRGGHHLDTVGLGVRLAIDDDYVSLTITEDRRENPADDTVEPAVASRMAAIASRAVRLGGTFEERHDGQRTTASIWRIPRDIVAPR